MERATGIGGIFLRANDPTVLARWYTTNLGVDADAWQLRVSSEPPLQDPPVFVPVPAQVPPHPSL